MPDQPRNRAPRKKGFLEFDPERVLLNARKAKTEDLLDRVTAYREDMEPEAVEIIEQELRARGVTPEQIAAHAEQRRGALQLPGGGPARCSFCRRPAVAEGWGWHRLFGLLPIFPRPFRYCSEHRPNHSRPQEL